MRQLSQREVQQPAQGHTWIAEKPGFKHKNPVIELPVYTLALLLRGARGEGVQQIMFTVTIHIAKLRTD